MYKCTCVFDLVLLRKNSCWVVPVLWGCLWRLTGYLRDLPSSGPTIWPASATYTPTSLPWMTSLSLFTGTHSAIVQIQHALDLAHEKLGPVNSDWLPVDSDWLPVDFNLLIRRVPIWSFDVVTIKIYKCVWLFYSFI